MSTITTTTAAMTENLINDVGEKGIEEEDYNPMNISTSSNSVKLLSIPFRFRRRSADTSGSFATIGSTTPRRKLQLRTNSKRNKKSHKKRAIRKMMNHNIDSNDNNTTKLFQPIPKGNTGSRHTGDGGSVVTAPTSDSKLLLNTSLLSAEESCSSSDSTVLSMASEDIRIRNTRIVFASVVHQNSASKAAGSPEDVIPHSSQDHHPPQQPISAPVDDAALVLKTSPISVTENSAALVLKTSPSSSFLHKPYYSCAESLLQHNFEILCGRRHRSFDEFDYLEEDKAIAEDRPSYSIKNLLPDDPTVQESIECVFAYQREQSLKLKQEEEKQEQREEERKDNDDDDDEDGALLSPAGLQQSYQRYRVQDSKEQHYQKSINNSKRGKKHKRGNKKRLSTIDALVNLGTCSDPHDNYHDYSDEEKQQQQQEQEDSFAIAADYSRISTEQQLQWALPSLSIADSSFCLSTSQCICSTHLTPSLPPHLWPQYPLLLRPTPNSGMTILGVRFSKSNKDNYLWQPSSVSNKNRSWFETLYNNHWRVPLPQHLRQQQRTQPLSREQQEQFEYLFRETRRSCCTQCCFLPINNGNEPTGETLVTDFETKLFVGTLLVRLRHTNGTTKEKYDDAKGYFAGLNRRYQVVVQGKFKQQLSMTKMQSGFQYNRPCGRLPPKWILKGGIKVISFFAPQLKTKFDSAQPYSLTPLGSTPQSLIVQDDDDQSNNNTTVKMEGALEEPMQSNETLLGDVYDEKTTAPLQRARFRKKAFDKLYIRQSPFPQTDKNKVYTFEFLQHLIDFTDLSLDLGSLLGKISLKDVLDGQPIQIMARYNNDIDDSNSTSINNMLWAFELWHANLVPDSLKHDKKNIIQ